VPYGIPFGLNKNAVHTKCQIIYTYWSYYVDAVYQQVYRMAEKVVDCCKGTTVCEVGSLTDFLYLFRSHNEMASLKFIYFYCIFLLYTSVF
jgi:hypothetical protein